VRGVEVHSSRESGFTVSWSEPSGGSYGARGYSIAIQVGGKGPYLERGADLEARGSPTRHRELHALPVNQVFKVKVAAVNPDGSLADYSAASAPIVTSLAGEDESVEMSRLDGGEEEDLEEPTAFLDGGAASGQRGGGVGHSIQLLSGGDATCLGQVAQSPGGSFAELRVLIGESVARPQFPFAFLSDANSPLSEEQEKRREAPAGDIWIRRHAKGHAYLSFVKTMGA